jgi:hypothetical protein
VPEVSDTDTRHYVERIRLPAHIEVLVVLERAPQTKPKAMNYGKP